MAAASWITALFCSYIVGSIPMGYWIVKRVKKLDVRKIGSGNIGATNVTRVAGLSLGRVVFALDAAKGLIAVLFFALLAPQPTTLSTRLLCGLSAVLGHVFPVFLRFRGGKGVATLIGVLLGSMPWIALGYLLVWGLLFAVSRTVSLASIVASLSLPILQAIAGQSSREVLLGAVLGLLLVIRHSDNIVRLLQGTEHRFK